MSILTRQISKYLEYCQYQKRLDEKTLKAYRIDLRQFSEQLPSTDIVLLTSLKYIPMLLYPNKRIYLQPNILGKIFTYNIPLAIH